MSDHPTQTVFCAYAFNMASLDNHDLHASRPPQLVETPDIAEGSDELAAFTFADDPELHTLLETDASVRDWLKSLGPELGALLQPVTVQVVLFTDTAPAELALTVEVSDDDLANDKLMEFLGTWLLHNPMPHSVDVTACAIDIAG